MDSVTECCQNQSDWIWAKVPFDHQKNWAISIGFWHLERNTPTPLFLVRSAGVAIFCRDYVYIYMIICVLYINLVHIVTSIGNSWHLQSATAAISVSLKSSPFAIISNKYSSLNSNGSNTDVKQKGKPVSLRSHQLHSLNSLTQLFSNATVKATQGSLLASDCLTSSLNLKVLNFTNDLSCHSPTPQWQIQSVNWLYPFL